MKQAFYFLFFLISALASNRAEAQTSVKCVDPDIQARAESFKASFEKQGKVVFQESMISMTSMEPSPVAVRLQQGVTYELIFVGSSQASRMMLELFDGADKKLDHKIEKDASHLLYTFTPSKTELYLVALTQKKGVKDMCGYFAIMVKKPAQSGPKVAPVKNNAPAATPVKAAPAKAVKKTTTTTKKTTPAQKATTTTTITNTIPTTTPNKDLPANQRPNPNRTRATQQHQQEQQKP